MPRSFRLLPPEPRPDLLARPRLIRTLVERWDRRVTTLVGGAGLGKSTALAQAVAENLLAPRGLDLWIGLESRDGDAERLAEAVTLALATRDDPGTVPPNRPRVDRALTAGAVGDAVWQRSPTEVCLILDDVHRLPVGSTGAAWLAELIEGLPANGHVVLASRAEPPVPLSRLGSHGAVLRLGPEALRFSRDELSDFAAQRGVAPAQLVGTGGWPALAELTANVDRQLAGVYLWEEVLGPLGDDRRAVLAAVADLGGADDGLASATLERPVDLARALDGVPLVDRTAGGWHVPHALWRQAPGLALDPTDRAAIRRRAVRYLTGLGRFDDAFSLVAQAGLWELAPEMLRAACLASDRLVAGQLARWLAAGPVALRESTPGVLASGLLAAFTEPVAAVEPLGRAIARCRADDDVDAEMCAIAQLARVAWFQQDHAVLGEVVNRVNELEATGHAGARALATVARAAIADLLGDDAELLAHLDGIEPSVLDRAWELLVSFWGAQVRLGLGQSGRIHEIVDRLGPGDDPALRGAGLGMRVAAWWAEGNVEAVLQQLPEMVAAMRAAGVQHSLYLALNGASMACARTGDLVTARQWYEESLAAAPVTPTGELTMRSSMALSHLCLGEGDEVKATAVLRAASEAHGVDQGIDRDTWRQHIALSYVLLPETREHWDDRELHGHLLTARTLAAALVTVREGGSDAALRHLELPEPGAVRSSLDVRFAVELVVGLVGAGRAAEGRTLLESLGPPGRDALRDLAAGTGRLAGPAKALLAAVPAAPPLPTQLGVLGQMLLRREGAEDVTTADPDLRRSKVREMLGFLVVHRRTTRVAIAAALWPELDERAASNNLAVTLNRLLQVLEPWRHSGEPAYLLRIDGPAVHLVPGEHLRIDVDEFDHHVVAAAQAESDGLPSLALEHDLAAMDLYRGDMFADLPEAEWFTLDREHHRIRFVGAAIRAGQLLLGRGDLDAAERAARRALTADRWSEEAYTVLVGAAMARRDRSGAHRILVHCLDALQELGAEPSPATRQLQRRLTGTKV